MTDPDPDPDSGPDHGPYSRRDGSEAQQEARRRRRLAALGDTSAERSADDSDDGWSERAGAKTSDRDDELRRDVPPHHG